MQRILLRAGKSPFDILDAQASLNAYPSGVFGTNVGNLVYSDAVHRILSTPTAEVVPNNFLGERPGVDGAYLRRINESFDHFVVPLANAFRPSFARALERLTGTIEGLDIPVTVVGVGVEGTSDSCSRASEQVDGDLKQLVHRFMKAVLARSARVGVRGEITRQFLRDLGYGDEHVEVIGCPSLFRNGGALTVEKSGGRLNHDDLISMSISPHVEHMRECALRHAALYSRLVYIAQDLPDLQLLLEGSDPRRPDPSMPGTAHPLYRSGRMLFFLDSRSWIDFHKDARFAFGSRIHGNIAALVAGTPAVVLVHDTRIRELVDYHQIPSRLAAEGAKLDAAQLYEEADYSAFNRGHQGRCDVYLRFLRGNGLETVFDPGRANAEYDRRMANLPLPGAVRPSAVQQPAGMRDRLKRRWLQRSYRFRAPVPHGATSALDRIVAATVRLTGDGTRNARLAHVERGCVSRAAAHPAAAGG